MTVEVGGGVELTVTRGEKYYTHVCISIEHLLIEQGRSKEVSIYTTMSPREENLRGGKKGNFLNSLTYMHVARIFADITWSDE